MVHLVRSRSLALRLTMNVSVFLMTYFSESGNNDNDFSATCFAGRERLKCDFSFATMFSLLSTVVADLRIIPKRCSGSAPGQRSFQKTFRLIHSSGQNRLSLPCHGK